MMRTVIFLRLLALLVAAVGVALAIRAYLVVDAFSAAYVLGTVVTLLATGTILTQVRSELTYWPALRLLGTLLFSLTTMRLLFVVANQFGVFHEPGWMMLVRVAIDSAVTVWTMVLVLRRNSVLPSHTIDLVGKELPLTPREVTAHEEVVRQAKRERLMRLLLAKKRHRE